MCRDRGCWGKQKHSFMRTHRPYVSVGVVATRWRLDPRHVAASTSAASNQRLRLLPRAVCAASSMQLPERRNQVGTGFGQRSGQGLDRGPDRSGHSVWTRSAVLFTCAKVLDMICPSAKMRSALRHNALLSSYEDDLRRSFSHGEDQLMHFFGLRAVWSTSQFRQQLDAALEQFPRHRQLQK